MKEMNQPQEMPTMLDLKESQLPQIRSWKVGGKYRIIVDVEQVSLHKGMGMNDDKGQIRASFKVISAKSAGESKSSEPEKPVSREAKIAHMDEKAKTA